MRSWRLIDYEEKVTYILLGPTGYWNRQYHPGTQQARERLSEWKKERKEADHHDQNNTLLNPTGTLLSTLRGQISAQLEQNWNVAFRQAVKDVNCVCACACVHEHLNMCVCVCLVCKDYAWECFPGSWTPQGLFRVFALLSQASGARLLIEKVNIKQIPHMNCTHTHTTLSHILDPCKVSCISESLSHFVTATDKIQEPNPKPLIFAVFTWLSHYNNHLDKETQTVLVHIADAAVRKS